MKYVIFFLAFAAASAFYIIDVNVDKLTDRVSQIEEQPVVPQLIESSEAEALLSVLTDGIQYDFTPVPWPDSNIQVIFNVSAEELYKLDMENVEKAITGVYRGFQHITNNIRIFKGPHGIKSSMTKPYLTHKLIYPEVSNIDDWLVGDAYIPPHIKNRKYTIAIREIPQGRYAISATSFIVPK